MKADSPHSSTRKDVSYDYCMKFVCRWITVELASICSAHNEVSKIRDKACAASTELRRNSTVFITVVTEKKLREAKFQKILVKPNYVDGPKIIMALINLTLMTELFLFVPPTN